MNFPLGNRALADRIELDEWADSWAESMAIEKQADQDNNRPRSKRQGRRRRIAMAQKLSPGSANAERHLEDRQKYRGGEIQERVLA